MSPASDAAIIAAVARLEEAVKNLEKIVVDMRDDGKERRAETARLLEILNKKIDVVADRVSESEGLHASTAQIVDRITSKVEEIEKDVAIMLPHVDALRASREQQKEQRGNRWMLWVAVLGSLALVAGEATWQVLDHLLHWGG